MPLLAVLLFSIAAGRELWLPVAGRATSGSGRTFRTELTITNPSERPADVTLSFFPSARPHQPPRTFELSVPASSLIVHDLGVDLVAPETPTGGLRIESNAPVLVSARVHAGAAAGVFRALPPRAAIGTGQSTTLRGTSGPDRYRLYAVETKGHPLYFSVRLFDGAGRPRSSRRLYLSGLEQRSWEFTEPFTTMRIEGINGSGRIVAAGSVVDAATGGVSAFEMEVPGKPRHRLGTGEIAAYAAVAGMLIFAAVRKRG